MRASATASVSLLLADSPMSGPASTAANGPLVDDPAGVLAVLLVVLAAIFWMTRHPTLGKIFKIVPALALCYFVPATLTSLHVIPSQSGLYEFIKDFVLPACLLLLVLSLDIPGILRLGPKAIIMLLAGTASVVVGGPLALLATREYLPPDAWRGMAALAGSWIGGGANMAALKETANASEEAFGAVLVVDAAVAGVWLGVLFFFAGKQDTIDRWFRADASAIRDLERRMTDYQERVSRIPALAELMYILALGFMGGWIAFVVGNRLPEIGDMIGPFAWRIILVTAIGLILSLTPLRGLEGAGASKVGSVMIYLLVASFGARADFSQLREYPAFIVMGFIWMAVHAAVMLGVGRLIRAPVFFIAVGSQSNIGGAASAPLVASAFHPSLAPVGALLAVAGYVLGTYAGLVCMAMLKAVASAGA